MSSDDSLSIIIETIQILSNDYYIDVACFVAIVYDWVLTFPDEIQVIWRRPVTGAKALYLLTRYFYIALYVVYIVSDFTTKSCSSVGSILFGFATINDLVVCAFQALRVYAISGRIWQFALLVDALDLYPVCWEIYLWTTTTESALPPPFHGCGDTTNLSFATYNKFFITESVCRMAADVITIIVTIYHTYETVKASSETKTQAPLTSRLIREGVLYFCVMLVANTSVLIVNVTTNQDYIDDVAFLCNYLLITHFLLNLQDTATTTSNGLDPSHIRSEGQDRLSSIRFANSLIGNLGATLRDESCENDEDEDEGVNAAGGQKTAIIPYQCQATSTHTSLPSSDDNREVVIAGPSKVSASAVHNDCTPRLTNLETVV